MAGEGDSDAGIFVIGMLAGAAVAHNFSAASSGAGIGPMGIPVTIMRLFLRLERRKFIQANRRERKHQS